MPNADIFDPAADGGVGAWTDTGSMVKARKDHTATLLPDGRVLTAGGPVGGTAMTSAELFTPVQGNITFLFLLLGD